MRTLVVWCPDWPVAAAVRDAPAGAPVADHVPVAVLAAGRVRACSALARAAGVRRGQRRREAQARCPELVVVADDPGRDVRLFEPVVAAVEAVAPGVEILEAGTCALAARGSAGHPGGSRRGSVGVAGEAAVAEAIVDRVAADCEVEAQVGVADGVFAARLAARAGQLVPPGGTPDFLAGLDVRVLGRPELTSLLRRLGIRTLGAFAALPAGDVLARFGFDGAAAHRLARGAEQRGLAPRTVPPDLVTGEEYEPPLVRVDVAAFAARRLAERLCRRLADHGTATTRLVVEAVTEDGQHHQRTWAAAGPLTVAGMTERVRWQLEGWLTAADRPTAGIARLVLVPDGLVEAAGPQPELWGGGEDGGPAARAVTHVQGLLGAEGVLAAVVSGGRSPAERIRWAGWDEPRVPAPPAPWPGQLPAPSPTVVPEAMPAAVLAADGTPVGVTGRHTVTAAPASVVLGAGAPGASGAGASGAGTAGAAGAGTAGVAGWAGPWPATERWWTPGAARRLARLQVALSDGRALLLAIESGRWRVEASYD